MPRLQPSSPGSAQETIEAAALRLFIRQGYSGTTTREIASAVGLTAGALYAHYPSKEALFAAVVERYRSRLVTDDSPLRRVLRESRFPYDLPELAAAIRTLVRTHRAYWRLWYVDVLEFDGKHFQSTLAPKTVLLEPRLKQRLAELREKRALRVDPEVAFVMVYMHLFNFFLVETLFGGRGHYTVPEERAVAAIAEVFLNGLVAGEEGSRRAIA